MCAQTNDLRRRVHYSTSLHAPYSFFFFFFSSRRRHTRCGRDWSSDVCSSDLLGCRGGGPSPGRRTPSPTIGAPMTVYVTEEFTPAEADILRRDRKSVV